MQSFDKHISEYLNNLSKQKLNGNAKISYDLLVIANDIAGRRHRISTLPITEKTKEEYERLVILENYAIELSEYYNKLKYIV